MAKKTSILVKSAFRFSLDISRQKYLHYYAGKATSVQVQSVEGKLIRFPASALKSWVTHQGVSGNFIIVFDENHKLVELKKLG